jgi:hypothetical protein
MGTIPERKKTTKYACERIKTYLEGKEPDYTSALLLSSIYADMRLRTLLTDWMSPTPDKWEKTSSLVLNKISFWGLIVLCDKLGLLQDKKERKNLDELREERNNVAHDSTLWKKLEEPKKKKIERLCNFTMKFLKRTNG